jgi:hypothetical protein
MKTIRLSVILMLTWISLSLAGGAVNPNNVDDHGVILHGYDAVSYFQGNRPLKGDEKFEIMHDDAIYLFSNETNKQAFLKDPQKYEPQFGGWCAYAVSESKSKVDVDPESFLIQDGKLLLFYKNWILGNTREKWLHTKDKTPEIYLNSAERNWPETRLTKP